MELSKLKCQVKEKRLKKMKFSSPQLKFKNFRKMCQIQDKEVIWPNT